MGFRRPPEGCEAQPRVDVRGENEICGWREGRLLHKSQVAEPGSTSQVILWSVETRRCTPLGQRISGSLQNMCSRGCARPYGRVVPCPVRLQRAEHRHYKRLCESGMKMMLSLSGVGYRYGNCRLRGVNSLKRAMLLSSSSRSSELACTVGGRVLGTRMSSIMASGAPFTVVVALLVEVPRSMRMGSSGVNRSFRELPVVSCYAPTSKFIFC
jgi:hypothetical protein